MSGIALIYMRNDLPVDSIVFEKMIVAMTHRGPDGSDSLIHASLGLGHQHFWTTSEEVGECQPLTLETLSIAFDGRLDNREELLAALNLDTIDDRQLSDAAIVVRAFRHWGNACFSRLLGPFVAVIYDHHHQQVTCARDPLGDRTLYYFVNDNIVLVASEEQALLRHPSVPEILDEDVVAQYFALKFPRDGSTMFAEVKEIQPGMVMSFDSEKHVSTHYWEFSVPADIRYATDAEYAEDFLALLQASVRCRLRSTTSTAVLMSGGLDSTSVVAVAAHMVADPLTTVSWVYEELKGPDERVFIDACNAHLQTTPLLLTGDDAWPLSDIDSWPINPNHPFCDPYERLSERAYRTVSERGIRPLLTGLFGDDLYSGYEYWMLDLLREGCLWETAVQLGRQARLDGVRYALTGPNFKVLARTTLNHIPGGQRVRPEQRLQRTWLNIAANERIQDKNCYSHTPPAAVRRPNQFRSIFGEFNTRGAITARTNALRFAVDLRHPYRDRRLIEFALAIPAYQLYKPGLFKNITMQAMQNLLPDRVRLRTHFSTFMPLLYRGIAERELPQVVKILGKENAMWSKFVNRDFIPLESANDLQNHLYSLSESELIVIWWCISFELWRERVQCLKSTGTSE